MTCVKWTMPSLDHIIKVCPIGRRRPCSVKRSKPLEGSPPPPFPARPSRSESLFWMAAAYRKAALEHHPDKKGAATADEETKRAIEQHFTLIQDAYETLSDPAKRREYNSVDDFDDTLPYECQPADFFKVCICTSWSGVHEPVSCPEQHGFRSCNGIATRSMGCLLAATWAMLLA